MKEDFHALYDSGFRKSLGIKILDSIPQVTKGVERLSATVPDIVVDYDEVTQIPNRIVIRKAIPLELDGTSQQQAVLQFIREHNDIWNLNPDDNATIQILSVSEKGLPTVNLIQRIENKEVFNSEVTASVSANNEVISFAGQFFQGAGAENTKNRASAETITSAEEAIAKAASDITDIAYTASDFTAVESSQERAPYRFYAFNAHPKDRRSGFERDVRLKDVMFPLGEGYFVPAFYVELWVLGFPAFSYVIDAIDTPDILYRRNLTNTLAFKYRVYNMGDSLFRPEDGPAPGTPHPTGTPNAFQAPTITQRLIDVESLLPNRPWLSSNARTTKGNNCFAYADLAAPNGFSSNDVVGEVTQPGVFNHVYDHTKPASDSENLQASLVGMFFHVNWLHDRWYEAGFDEASGNAQENNFGLGGLGGDPILAEGNDFSGTDNANMSTPADGASPRMQMFEFFGPTPEGLSRTSNFEALITFHEMGHYITNRLVGNANGLTNNQGRAMGEGWGDFFAICMTSKESDSFANGAFAAGGWTDVTPTFKENYYFSIRRYPYSSDMSKNPLTFKHIANNVLLPTGPPRNPNAQQPNNEVHAAGEIWCTALWEVFVNLVIKHGHAEAENRMLTYVIGGLKLTPLRPTFTQARDAIVTAVSSLHPEDQPEVWIGFAKRGMGRGAVSPPSSSTSFAGVVESFVG